MSSFDKWVYAFSQSVINTNGSSPRITSIPLPGEGSNTREGLALEMLVANDQRES